MKQQQQGMINRDRFSYYEVMIVSTKVKRAIDAHPGLREYILYEIKKDEPAFKATELRDDIPIITKKPKAVKKLLNGKIDFSEAQEFSKVSKPTKYIRKALTSLREIEKKEISKLDSNDLNIADLDLKRCKQEIIRVENMIKNEPEN